MANQYSRSVGPNAPEHRGLGKGEGSHNTGRTSFRVLRNGPSGPGPSAFRNDYEYVVGQILDLRPDIADLLGEISLVENDPEIEPGDRFEQLAQDAPSREQLLKQSVYRGN